MPYERVSFTMQAKPKAASQAAMVRKINKINKLLGARVLEDRIINKRIVSISASKDNKVSNICFRWRRKVVMFSKISKGVIINIMLK